MTWPLPWPAQRTGGGPPSPRSREKRWHHTWACRARDRASWRSRRSARAASRAPGATSRLRSRPSGHVIAVVDSGPLYAVTDTSDEDHLASLEVLQRRDLRLVVPALVVGEVTYMVGRRLGPAAEGRFLEGLEQLDVEAPTPGDFARMAELVRLYGDFPLGGTDASVVALAERLLTPVVITLDRRHFAAMRPRHCDALELLPA